MKKFTITAVFSAFFLVFCFTSALFSAYPQTIIKTPQEASKGLYQAWSKRQRKAVQNYARAEAVEKLFSARRQNMVFKGCTKLEEGDYECIYENKKLDLSVAMLVKIYRVGYRVAEVSFSSEVI